MVIEEEKFAMYILEVSKMQAFIALVGRMVLGAVFLLSACFKIMDATSIAETMTSNGLSMSPIFLTGAILIELIGGLALITGVVARSGALILIVYLSLVTFLVDAAWIATLDSVALQAIVPLTNLAIIGGLFVVVAFGPGPMVIEPEKLEFRPIANNKNDSVASNSHKKLDEVSNESPGAAGADDPIVTAL